MLLGVGHRSSFADGNMEDENHNISKQSQDDGKISHRNGEIIQTQHTEQQNKQTVGGALITQTIIMLT